jgi:7-carboxy-7-deazaguanine synthase
MYKPPPDVLPIMEEFVSVQGEGRNIGMPYYFIRVGGCPLRCNFCDTERSWTADPATAKPIIDIVLNAALACSEHGIKWLSVTGGEPLLYPQQLLTLIGLLDKHAPFLKIHIETSGAIYNKDVHDACDLYSPDAKTPCTGEHRKGYFKGIENIREQDQVKCLISNYADLEYAHRVNRAIAKSGCPTILQPFNTEIPTESTSNMTEEQKRSLVTEAPSPSRMARAMGVGLQSLLEMYRRSSSLEVWSNVIITPQIHVLAYGNKPNT